MPFDFEKLGVFYLGARYDLERRQRLAEPILYDSKDLVTHAVCVGMTGSGKTGLGISVIEEAALDGIPVIAIDPKGDLPNLLLDPPPDQAERWQRGLAEWGEDAARVTRLREAAEFRVYTPGSRAGIPLAMFKSMAPPQGGDPETQSSRATTVAASLLTLAGLTEVAPHAREQVFMANLLAHSWQSGKTPDLPGLIQQVQRPPLERIGVLDLETFFPAKERQDLALRLNSVIAAPGFDTWLSGEPLDAAALLHSPAGKPRVSIVSIAHLPDAERMLVVSLLLNAVLEWTRQQTGTTSLRALIYMDEVFGYFPPSANPPAKAPLLTLLKQARAYGVGVMLSTQNPVDLDYKGLSNTGTWFLGKLQTERDKMRVLDGLEGAAPGLDRQQLDRTLSALPGRVFLLHNVHEPAPVIFETRWALSYLKGPMTLEEIRSRGTSAPGQTSVTAVGPAGAAPAGTAPTAQRPAVPAGVREYFFPGPAATYEPVLYGAARVRYADSKRGVNETVDLRLVTHISDGPVPIDWDRAADADVSPEALADAPSASASFATLPTTAMNPRSYIEWTRDFERSVARVRPLRLFAAPELKLSSRVGESERDFAVRVQQAVREKRDAAVEALRAKYSTRIARVEEKLRRAHEATNRERQQVGQQKLQTAVSIGATVLGALMGRKAISMSTLGRATTAVRGVSRSQKEAEDVSRAESRAADVQEELRELQAELERAVEALSAELGRAPQIETAEIPPQRGGIDVQLVTLAWQPGGRVG